MRLKEKQKEREGNNVFVFQREKVQKCVDSVCSEIDNFMFELVALLRLHKNHFKTNVNIKLSKAQSRKIKAVKM